MLNAYLTEDEFYQKYSPYQKGQTVTIIKPIYCDNGKFEAGAEFIIEDVKLKYGMTLPKVFSNKADDFYADERMFTYIVRSKEYSDIKEYVNIGYFEKNKFVKREFLSNIMLFSAVIAFVVAFLICLIATMLFNDERYVDYVARCFCVALTITVISQFCSGKPKLHKKRKRK